MTVEESLVSHGYKDLAPNDAAATGQSGEDSGSRLPL